MVLRLLICLISLLALDAAAQHCPPLPDPSAWKQAEDFRRSRDSVEKVLGWLCRSPFSEHRLKRSEANACVLLWIAGSSDLRVEVDTRVLPFVQEDEELLYSVIHGMALYQMRHPRETDPVRLHAEGIAVLAALASQSETLSEAKYMREVLRAWRRERIEDYVREQISEARRH